MSPFRLPAHWRRDARREGWRQGTKSGNRDVSHIRAMSKWRTFGFTGAALLVTLGALDQLFDSDSHPLVECLLGLPWVLHSCSTPERFVGGRPPPLAKACLLVALILLTCEHLPQSVSFRVQPVIHHPVLVTSLWLFLSWRIFLRWRGEKATNHA